MPRCYLIYARAPEHITAAEANDLLNSYVADERRGLAVFHDHFTGRPHGGFVVLDVRTEDELALLDDPLHSPVGTLRCTHSRSLSPRQGFSRRRGSRWSNSAA
jgi:hypothetical protein